MTPDNNYRKVKPGEISCMDCRYAVPRYFRGIRHRCNVHGYSYVVGQYHTCDRAERPKGDC